MPSAEATAATVMEATARVRIIINLRIVLSLLLFVNKNPGRFRLADGQAGVAVGGIDAIGRGHGGDGHGSYREGQNHHEFAHCVAPCFGSG
jgi:hypothetical protein